MSLAATIRLQVEAQLQNRIPSALSYRARAQAEALPIGIKEIDGPLGGIPRGALTEITGPDSSGRTSLMLSILAAGSEQQECCALIDVSSSFDPLSAQAAGVRMQQVLWVRCGAGAPMKRLERALQSADMLLHAGGFGIVIFDAADFPAFDAQ